MARSEDEPTEEPTPQRLLKARREGQVAISRDFAAGLGFAALVAVLAATAPAGAARMLVLFRQALAAAAQAPGDPAATDAWLRRVAGAAHNVMQVFTATLAVPLGVALGAAVLVGAIQTGGLFAWQATRPDFNRLSPLAGFKRVFGVRTLGEIGKGLVKVMVVTAVAATSVGAAGQQLPHLAGARPAVILTALGHFSQRLGVRVALALVALGTLDWLWARRWHRRSLMMTRDEVKREYKEAEGDPRHRAERQRLHRELNEQRMIEDVRKADFVVVNPEHIAVAVKYDRESDGAPQVVAKGERLLAERIKQVAREAGVPIYRDIGLARALNELPEGEEIPEVLYEAVAELLRVLWEVDVQPPGGAAGAAGAPSGGSVTGAATADARSSPSTWKRV